LVTAWPKLNTGPGPNQTKALAELRRKCGKCFANSSALQIQVPANCHFRCVPFTDVAKYPQSIYVSGIIARTEEGFA
jgi:hypothetical protein